MCMQNLVLVGLFVFKISSKNSILMLIKGRNSIAKLPKFKLIQAFMHVLVTCKNEDQIENEGARLLTRLLPNKSMGIFQDAQGQLTLQSKIEALECSQHYTSIFQMRKGR